MNRSQQRGKERRVGRIADEETRKNQRVEADKSEWCRTRPWPKINRNTCGGGTNKPERKANSQRLPGTESADGRAGRAIFRVRLDTGSREMSCSGTRCAPAMRGSF